MPLRHAASPLTALTSVVQPRRCLLYTPFFLTPAAGAPRQQQQQQQPFHSTARLCDEQIDNAQNHYETLKLHPGATPAEIKKSFYTLSKTHHPDHNPSNPQSSQRFMRISEAYSILSIPAKRAAYDRDVLRLQHSHFSHHQGHVAHHHRGSYSSSTTTTNPAGGRPASGLSRRRGAFQGPPPSFFRSGGWGAQGAKRRAAHEDSTGSTSSSSTSSSSTNTAGNSNNATGGSTAGGMGPGQTPFRGESDVPHFDRESHERTGRHHDRRRAQRRGGGGEGRDVDVEPERGMAGMFFVIGGVLVLSVLGPFAIGRMWRSSTSGNGNGNGKENKKGGSGKKKKKSVPVPARQGSTTP
ncbi:hypothetical protein M426DRAFT_324786 [Hypoxylon sp. CI-4A]|nr:hypothetical protein M426DRAFT_324786 [Hypoxylon sp. CI-4A]